jgi:hypothetical protein
MSTLTEPRNVSLRGRAAWSAAFVTTALVLAVSVAEFINLSGRHTVGAESYGLVVSGVAVTAGILSLALTVSTQKRVLTTAAVLILWAVVAMGGIAGTYYHIVGVAPQYGPVDPRPRPVAAPLIFTLLGTVGGAALFIGHRGASRRARELREE